jgi:hypothetical protein
MMEALMLLLSAEMPVDAMTDLIDEHDTRLCAEAVIVTKKIVGIKLEGLAQKSAPDIEQNDGISRAKTGAKTLARQAIASQVR